MSTLRLHLAALALVLALTGATAEGCQVTTSRPEFVAASCAVGGAPCVYVESDPCGGSGTCLFSIWVYQESNGVAGLQRSDEVRDDTCGGEIAGDTILL